MRRWMVLLAAVAGLTGCQHPVRVCTDSRLRFAEPVGATVTAHMGSTDQGPLGQRVVGWFGGGSRGSGKVAVVDVDGLLANARLSGPYSAGENPVALFREKLDAVARDRSVCAVVIRINSPGGAVTASDIMRQELERFRSRTGRPVVACLMGVAAGGGYYLATAADVIYAHPTTVTGGIGVILNHYNLQDTLAQYNVRSEPVKAGQYIDMGTSASDMPPEVRDWLQGMANEFHRRFIEVVVASRAGVQGDEAELFDGRVFTARQALDRGLIDQIGYLEDATAAACQLAGQERARVVMFRRDGDPARTPYAVTANQAVTGGLLPLSVPGLERSKLPTFLYLWQPEPTVERLTGS